MTRPSRPTSFRCAECDAMTERGLQEHLRPLPDDDSGDLYCVCAACARMMDCRAAWTAELNEADTTLECAAVLLRRRDCRKNRDHFRWAAVNYSELSALYMMAELDGWIYGPDLIAKAVTPATVHPSDKSVTIPKAPKAKTAKAG